MHHFPRGYFLVKKNTYHMFLSDVLGLITRRTVSNSLRYLECTQVMEHTKNPEVFTGGMGGRLIMTLNVICVILKTNVIHSV